MFLLRYVLRLIFFISLCLSQGPFNSYGIGDVQVWNSASAGGSSSLGLVSSYRQNISLANPTTWSNLKYTFLSLSYNGFESALKNNSKNGYSNLQSVQLIIPIKNKYALGIELHPYSYQKIDIIDTLLGDNLIAFEDTLLFQKQFVQAGGVMAFDISTSASIFSKTSLAMTFQLLFGSSRQSKNLLVDEIPYAISSRLNYSGVNTLFFLKQYAFGFDIFLRSQFAFKPLEAIQTKLYPYFDTNKNGYHDFTYDYSNPGYDFPNPNDVPDPEQSRISNIHEPSSFSFGLSKIIYDRLQVSLEFQNNKENAPYNQELPNGFNKRIIENDKISFGSIWYPSKQSFKFLDNLTFRSGLFFNNFTTDELAHGSLIRMKSKNNVTEFGYSIGFGYKFKAVGNQIDFAYSSSLKSFKASDIGEERLRGFQIGISIADIWFIKRRQR
tara:strand:+ start:1226 stop:2542 length:1317 start_codon:yes stop_codon:yes gene_type:complete